MARLGNFDYKTPDELDVGGGTVNEGEVSFTIKKNFDTDRNGLPLTTGKGDPKIKVVIEVKDEDNNTANIYEDVTTKTAWKMYNICKAIGRKDLYTSDGVEWDDTIGYTGRCIVSIEHKPGYNPRLVIDGYIYPEDAVAKPVVAAKTEVPNDDLPF